MISYFFMQTKTTMRLQERLLKKFRKTSSESLSEAKKRSLRARLIKLRKRLADMEI